MTGSSVIIFGASGGIGLAIKSKLDSEFSSLLSPSRSECDLSSSASVRAYLNRVSIIPAAIIFAAGINNPSLLDETDTATWEEVFQINFWSALQIFLHFAPLQEQLSESSNVVISSLYSERSRAGRAAYSASKSALDSLVRSFAVEYGGRNIRFNGIQPGFIGTQLTSRNNSADEIAALERRIPNSRLGLPDEVANLTKFLVSSSSTYVSGQMIKIDGGYSANA